MYRTKFEQLLVEAVSERSGLSKQHVLIIVNSLYKGLVTLMKDPRTVSVRIPFIGRFIYRKQKVLRLIEKMDRKKEYLSSIPDGILSFNFDMYVNLKYQYQRYINYEYNIKSYNKTSQDV